MSSTHAAQLVPRPLPLDNAVLLYGLLPPNYHPLKPVPTLIPKALTSTPPIVSLAFQSIICVRGSKLICVRQACRLSFLSRISEHRQH